MSIEKTALYLRFFRVFDWLHILGLTILGYAFNSETRVLSPHLLSGLIISALYLGHGYSLNECFDHHLSHKVAIGQYGFIPFKKSILLSYIALFAAILISSLYSWQVVFWVIFGGIASFLYSASIIKLKQVPWIGLFGNALCFTPLFLIGYAISRNLDLEAYLMAAFIFLLFLPIDLIHQLNDLNEDIRRNLKTTAVLLGIKKTLLVIVISLVSLSFWALILVWYLKISYYLFWLTLFLAIAIVSYLLIRFSGQRVVMAKFKLKTEMRYLFIVYGIGLLIIFTHK